MAELRDDSAAEIGELVWQLRAGTTAAATLRLEELLRDNLAARREYIRYMRVVSDLRMSLEPERLKLAAHPAQPGAPRVSPLLGFLGALGSLIQHSPRTMMMVLGGALTCYFLVMLALIPLSRWAESTRFGEQASKQDSARPGASAGSLKTDAGARWAQKSSNPTDAAMRTGQRYELAAGWVTIELPRGTRISIEGPATWQLESEQRLQLFLGRLAASVPRKAIGFTVATPAGEVVDLGTEFGVVVAGGGKTEVHVMQGKVEVKQPRAGGLAANAGMKLAAGEAVRMEVRFNGFLPITLDRLGFTSALQKLAAEPGAAETFVLDGPYDIRDGTIAFQEGVNGYTGTADTFLGGDPNTNYGSENYLGVWELGPNNNFRDLIRYDLSSVTPGTVVTAATLTLYQQAAYNTLGVINSLYVVAAGDKDWTESSATWNNKNQGRLTPWAGAPGLVAGTDYNDTPVATAVSPATVPGYDGRPTNSGLAMTFTLNSAGIAAIQSWINNPSNNTGFFLRQPDGSHSEDVFASSNASTASLHPLLTLTTIPAPEPVEAVH